MEAVLEDDTRHDNTPHVDEGETVQFLTFTLGDEEYGVDIMQVREVKGWTDATRLPNTPKYVRGVLNLRGMILPIFDLRTRFTGELTHATEKHVIVIIAVGSRIIGILADSVSDIITINSKEIKPAPSMDSSDVDSRFVDGLIAIENRMVVLLDMEKLIDTKIIDQVTSSSPSKTSDKDKQGE